MRINKSNIKHLFAKPVDIGYGKMRYLTYPEYLDLQPLLSLISMNNLHFYYYFKNVNTNPSSDDIQFFQKVKELNIYELLAEIPEILEVYVKMIELTVEFHEGYSTESIFEDKEYFLEFRDLFMEMNLLIEEEVSANEEIQEGINISKMAKKNNSDIQTYEDIVTAITASTNHSFNDVYEMTAYQVFSTYARVGAIYNYHTSTLFATVSSEITIEAWNKHIDLFKQETSSMTRSEFNRKHGSLF